MWLLSRVSVASVKESGMLVAVIAPVQPVTSNSVFEFGGKDSEECWASKKYSISRVWVYLYVSYCFSLCSARKKVISRPA